MDQSLKAWIDKAAYVQLLERWRRSPCGDPIFVGEVGEYYAKVMEQRRKEIGDDKHVEASKLIGWNP